MNWNTRKKEYWEINKHPITIFAINLRIKYRKYMIKTHGLGLIVIIMIVFLPIMLISQFIGPYIANQTHAEQLKQVCKDKDFYYLNFNACESQDARPTVITPVGK